MSSASRKLIQASGAVAGVADTGDDDFANVVLLLDGDGTSGDDNNTFTDSSTNAHTITENGSVVQGSFSPYGDNWSNYFDGVSTDYLSVSDSTGFDFGTGDFTVECWFYETGQVGGFSILGATEGVNQYFAYGSAFQGMTMYAGYSATDIYSGTSNTPEPNQWNHLVWQRKDGRGQMYINGTRVYDAVYSADFGATATGFQIGRSDSYNNYYAKGYISNFRVIKGVGYYDGASITVPTAPLTAVTNTELLTCSSNRFADESTNNNTITISGTPKVTPFSPFKDDDATDITTDGGSAYFDDSSNSYLQIADNSVFDATSSLCIEAWFYMTSAPGDGPNAHAVVSKWVSTTPGQRTIFIDIESTGLRVYADIQNSSNPVLITTDGGAISLHSWHHVAVTWDGLTYRAFLDGVLEGSTSNSNAPVASSQVVRVGHNTNTHYFGGYITDARWVTDGGAIYTSAFTPPTSPLTDITNTELLLNFQDSGIYDRTGLNNIDTVGDAQIDTAVKKYGTGSLEFDGTGDYLALDESEQFGFGTGDFTVEAWAYTSDNTRSVGGASQRIFDIGGGDVGIWLQSSTGYISYNIAGGVTATTTVFPENQWNHVALTRSGTSLKLFLNGTQVASTTNSSNLGTAHPATVGAFNNTSDGAFLGYIDDLRITKGIARYTSAFTPPDAALPKF